jgi:probable addiction module antidote protein
LAGIVFDYDPAKDLTSPEAIAALVNEALGTDDAAYVAHALGVVARAKGMAGVAELAELSCEGTRPRRDAAPSARSPH